MTDTRCLGQERANLNLFTKRTIPYRCAGHIRNDNQPISSHRRLTFSVLIVRIPKPAGHGALSALHFEQMAGEMVEKNVNVRGE